jgi:hypothetical protein
MQRISPKLIEMGQDPMSGMKYYGQQIGNQIVPVGAQGGQEGMAGGFGGLTDRLTQMNAQGATKEEKLNAIPTTYREGVRALVEGRDLPSNYGKAQVKSTMDQLAHLVDKDFDPTQIPARMQTRRAFAPGGKEGQMIISYNTTQHHLEQASDALETLAPLMSRFKTMNEFMTWANSKDAKQFPQYTDAMTALRAGLQATREEMSHVYNPGHIGESEQKQWNDLLDPNESPDKMRRNFYTFSNLMEGKRSALNDAYRTTFNEDVPLIHKDEGDRLKEKLRQRLPASAPERANEPVSVRPANTAGMPHVRNKEEMDKLTPGTQFVAPDGSVWTKK